MVYLTCTKNSSFQRKHVAVCQRCPTNSHCKAYSEYCHNVAAEIRVQGQTEVDSEQLLGHIIQELQSIRELTVTGKNKPAGPRAGHRKRTIQQAMARHDVLTVLHDIKTLCNRSHSK